MQFGAEYDIIYVMKKAQIDHIVKFYIKYIWLIIIVVLISLGLSFVLDKKQPNNEQIVSSKIIYNGKNQKSNEFTRQTMTANIAEVLVSRTAMDLMSKKYKISVEDLSQQMLVEHSNKNDIISISVKNNMPLNDQKSLLRDLVAHTDTVTSSIYGNKIIDWLDMPESIVAKKTTIDKKKMFINFVCGLILGLSLVTIIYFYKQ